MDRYKLIFLLISAVNFFLFLSMANATSVADENQVEEEVQYDEEEKEIYLDESELITDMKTYSDNFSTENVGETLPYAKLDATMEQFSRSPALAREEEEDAQESIEIDTEE